MPNNLCNLPHPLPLLHLTHQHASMFLGWHGMALVQNFCVESRLRQIKGNQYTAIGNSWRRCASSVEFGHSYPYKTLFVKRWPNRGMCGRGLICKMLTSDNEMTNLTKPYKNAVACSHSWLPIPACPLTLPVSTVSTPQKKDEENKQKTNIKDLKIFSLFHILVII